MVKTPFDREDKQRIVFSVMCHIYDSLAPDDDAIFLTSSRLDLKILDIDDNAPYIMSRNAYREPGEPDVRWKSLEDLKKVVRKSLTYFSH
jgi:hypothetical protein